MSTSLTIPSSLFLTLLIIIGLFFFIRASVKDRTEARNIALPLSPPDALEYLVKHFQGRYYQVIQQDPQTQTIILQGVVAPSWFLCLFLTLLAAIGLFALALVLSITVPAGHNNWYALAILSPLAGLFYWRGAGREEKISIQPQSTESTKTIARVEAHRDELRILEESLSQINPGE
ncbi:MAG: cofactor assembly of complex C subunit B [Prochlorotrichaceae cyanobacterium]|jgi:hypothetical protein